MIAAGAASRRLSHGALHVAASGSDRRANRHRWPAVPGRRFLALAAQVQPAVEQLDHEAAGRRRTGPTFFEVTTAMAFLHFAQAKVDAAVLEVGLGGRLDSTNVCRPEVCIITSISFDHTKQLGNTLAAIAGEKAGIIKPGVPVVSGVIDPEPRDVIAAPSRRASAPRSSNAASITTFRLPLRHSPLTHSPSSATSLRLPRAAASATAYQLVRHPARHARPPSSRQRRRRNRRHQPPPRSRLVDQRRCHPPRPRRRPLPGANRASRYVADVILDVAHNLASIEALLAVLRERYSPRAAS